MARIRQVSGMQRQFLGAGQIGQSAGIRLNAPPNIILRKPTQPTRLAKVDISPPPGGGTNWTQAIDDSVTMSDVVKFARGLVIGDSVAMSDAIKFARGLVIPDSVTMSDARTFQRGLTLSEAVTLADSISFKRNLAVSDSVTMSDAVRFARLLALADAVSLADATAFKRGLTINDALALADARSFLVNGTPYPAAVARAIRAKFFTTKYGFYG